MAFLLEKILLLVWVQGQAAPEASAGIPLVMENSLTLRRRKQGAPAPAPSTEKSLPHGSKRNGLAPRPWERCVYLLSFPPSKLFTHPALKDYIEAYPGGQKQRLEPPGSGVSLSPSGSQQDFNLAFLAGHGKPLLELLQGNVGGDISGKRDPTGLDQG